MFSNMKRLIFFLFISTLAQPDSVFLGDIEKQLAAREELFLLPKQAIVTYDVKSIEKKPANSLFSLKNDGRNIIFSAAQREERVVILPPVPSYSLSSPPLSFSYPAFSEIKREMEKRELQIANRKSEEEKKIVQTKEEPLYQFAFKMITRRQGENDEGILNSMLKEPTTKPTLVTFEGDLV